MRGPWAMPRAAVRARLGHRQGSRAPTAQSLVHMPELNPQQQKIVEHMEGPALVIAGAGSGKTRVITHRVARLIASGVPPSAILMVTFTNKAAEEMRRRVEGEVGGREAVRGLVAGTFHSVANRFLRRHATMIGYDSNFTICDDTDSRDLIKAAIAETVEKSDRKFPKASVVQTVLSMAFNRSLELSDLLRREYPWLQEFQGELEAVETVYRKKKRANNAMDFDDLLDNWCLLLAEHPNLEMVRKLRFLLVDEYQDTNVIQAEILTRLAAGHDNLMVVGDDAQSIYGWRGANFENILTFTERHGGAVYHLEQNYRSTPDILELANSSINHNTAQFTKHLQAVLPPQALPRLQYFRDEYEEADYLVERILDYRDQDIPLREMGVLYRNHMQAATLQIRLTQAGIPFTIRSGIRFFEQAHIKDVVAFLKVLFNPLDEIAWMRILKMLPGVGNATAQKIYRVFTSQQAVRLSPDNQDLLKAVPPKARKAWEELALNFKHLIDAQQGPSEMILKLTGGFYNDQLYSQFDNPKEREADLHYLADFASRYGTVERFLSQLALVGSTVIRDYEEDEAQDPEYLTLSTVHQAKGLEWDVVFVIGLADGRFPHSRCLEPVERLEEERRLFYVAVTRCRRHLEITVPRTVFTGGRAEFCRPSRFVEELPDTLLEVVGREEFDPVQRLISGGIQVDW